MKQLKSPASACVIIMRMISFLSDTLHGQRVLCSCTIFCHSTDALILIISYIFSLTLSLQST